MFARSTGMTPAAAPSASFYSDKPEKGEVPTPEPVEVEVTLSPGTFPEFCWNELKKLVATAVELVTAPCQNCRRPTNLKDCEKTE